MEKLKSIYRLDALNLNVPEVLHYQGANPTEPELLQLSHLLQAMQRKNGRISIRTENPNEFKSPFLPNATVPKAREFLRNLPSGRYEVLITKGVPTNSIIRGNCVPGTSDNYFEYGVGHGTVRDIDEGKTPRILRLPWGAYPESLGGTVATAIQLVNSFLYPRLIDLKSEIVEFSVFPKAVGVKWDRVIFWEVRKYGGPPRI